ncbi:MAG: bifunctional hydroxymethylpyrimidine kinase/phosphomethylpyrimidine kinase [Coriobacteriales bacterium]|jgi:hydroxymethylpyrimidine/phosphomethylpyrimidine kinase|nr:bifunctional hydroxymethylpyrimidine kinase/phosphomethylpyrimidine kinase [Coriobacteriales bacterium]
MRSVLTIAGSDSSGGAGIQADIKTITMFGLYAQSVITALTAQNTCGVSAVFTPPASFVAQQMESVFGDIEPQSVKTGMLANREVVEAVAGGLRALATCPVVVDPVMVATSGDMLLADDAVAALREQLLPLATLITPNVPEAEVLSGLHIEDEDDMARAARIVAQSSGAAVLVKGGHLIEFADGASGAAGAAATGTPEVIDILWNNGRITRFADTAIPRVGAHGTGCTLSAAIACGLAQGATLEESVRAARIYLRRALQASPGLGSGNGPVNHIVEAPHMAI